MSNRWGSRFVIPDTKEGIITRREELKRQIAKIAAQLLDEPMNATLPPDERKEWERKARGAMGAFIQEKRVLKGILRKMEKEEKPLDENL